MSDIQTGLLLLAIGFPTVFFILWLVIVLGKGLVLAVNKYAPEEALTKIIPATSPEIGRMQTAPNKIAAIVAAVNFATGGKATVTKIEKLS